MESLKSAITQYVSIKIALNIIILLANIAYGFLFMGLNQLSYDLTGSNQNFGSLLAFQTIVQLCLTILVGGVIDKYGPLIILRRSMSIFVSVLFISAIGIHLFSGILKAWLLLPMVNIALFGALIYQPIFVIIGALFSGDDLNKAHGDYTLFSQVGQMVGILISVPILRLLSPELFLLSNSLVYLLIILFIKPLREIQATPKYDLGKEPSWQKYFQELRTKPALGFYIFLSVLPFLLVTIFNLHLPVLNQQLTSQSFTWLYGMKDTSSIIDSLFCFGAAVAGYLSRRKLTWNPIFSLALVTVGFYFYLSSHLLDFGLIFYFLLSIAIGIFMAHLSIYQNSVVQKNSDQSIKGRVVATQQSLNMVLTLLLTRFY
jgi:hypothetical protein